MQPLPRDLFTSKDFYKDKDALDGQPYWRCNSPRQVADMRSGGAGSSTDDPRIGANPPVSARWGDCKMDWARENIVSPYPFKTAKEHYDALMADAKRRGGPTRHTYETMPKWDGAYGEFPPQGRRVWNYMRANQVPTMLSLLTPTYQQRMVQQLYHEGVNAAHQWSQSYCWPEGYMRQWATGLKWSRVLVTPEVVLLIGSGIKTCGASSTSTASFRWASEGPAVVRRHDRLLGRRRADHLDGQRPGLEPALGWEWSDRLEAIEIFTPSATPPASSSASTGSRHLRPGRARAAGADPVAPQLPAAAGIPPTGSGCAQCTRPLYPINGIPDRSRRPGQVIQYTVPDMLDRPWADIWEES